jgi:hypothetical protein
VFVNAGGGRFGAQQTFTVGTTPIALAAGDFNGDGLADLAVANNGSSTVSVLLSGCN